MTTKTQTLAMFNSSIKPVSFIYYSGLNNEDYFGFTIKSHESPSNTTHW